MDSPASTPAAAAGPSGSVSGSVPPSAAAAPRTKSKMYGSQLAKEGDVQKYRAKYKDLKIKVKEIEKDNDKIVLKIAKAKRAIQRVRMERALIYERLILNPIPPPTSPTNGGAAPPPPTLESFLVAPSSTSTSAPAPVPAPTSASAPAPPAAAAVPPPPPVPAPSSASTSTSVPAPPVAAQAPPPPPPTNGAGTGGGGLVDAGPPFPTPMV